MFSLIVSVPSYVLCLIVFWILQPRIPVDFQFPILRDPPNTISMAWSVATMQERLKEAFKDVRQLTYEEAQGSRGGRGTRPRAQGSQGARPHAQRATSWNFHCLIFIFLVLEAPSDLGRMTQMSASNRRDVWKEQSVESGTTSLIFAKIAHLMVDVAFSTTTLQ